MNKRAVKIFDEHEKKIKVCFISTKAYPLFNSAANDINFGGAEVQTFQFAKKLSVDDNFEVSFIVGDFGQASIETYGSIKIFKSRKTSRPLGFLSGVIEQIKFWITLKKTGSLVFIQRSRGVETGIISLFCKLYGKKMLYMIANLPDVDGSFKKTNRLSGWLYELGLKNANMIIAQNKEQQLFLEKKYAKKSIIIKNSFNLPQKVDNFSKEFILWVASSRIQKNPETFLQLAEDFPEEKFVMIMQKNDLKLWGKIYNQVKKIRNLTLIEKIPFSQIEKYFKKSKVFINTSSYEGFPNTFIQAAMFGTPILSFLVNPDNFINVYECGYVAEGKYETMKKQLDELLRNEDVLRKFSKNAFSYVKKNHDMEKNIIKLRSVINNLIKNNESSQEERVF